MRKVRVSGSMERLNQHPRFALLLWSLVDWSSVFLYYCCMYSVLNVKKFDGRARKKKKSHIAQNWNTCSVYYAVTFLVHSMKRN